MAAGVKTIWTDEMVEFLKNNYKNMTNVQLADALGLTVTVTRIKLAEFGIKRFEMEYWTEEQVNFLLDNYKIMGDVEIAEIFESYYPKKKKWTHHHIEKKRKYLKLKRTKDQIQMIFQRNKLKGRFAVCVVKRWETVGQAPEGTIRIWHQKKAGCSFAAIKVNGVWVHWNRWIWEKERGRIPKGMVIAFKNGDPKSYVNGIDALEMISREEMAKRNIDHYSDSHIAGYIARGNKELQEILKENKKLIELKRQQLKLNRELKNDRRQNKGNGR